MRSKSRQFVIFKEYLVLLGCIFISLILIFSNQNSQIEAIKIVALDFISLFQSRLDFGSRNASLAEQNSFLRTQNTILALENSRMRESVIENERLRKLIEFKAQSEFRILAAKVIGGKSLGFMNHISLDLGKQDSIKKNMPLILPEGLVGKIYHVEETRSLGQLLFDRNFRVSAKIDRSGVKGIIEWGGNQHCILNQVPNRSNVKVGDRVVTSGDSEIFPAGISIGKVVSATDMQRELFMNIKVKPDIDFDRLEEVLVIVTENSMNNLD